MNGITYLVIDVDGLIVKDVGPLGTEEAASLLGGAPSPMPRPTDLDVIVLSNVDARRQGLNPNWLATSIVKNRLRPDDFVVGRVIVTGGPNEDGDLTSISPEAEEAVRRMADK